MASNIAQEFIINSATLDAERGLPNGPIDIANMIMELSFFESLDKPYISGQLVLLDDQAILDELEFQGTEQINFNIAGGDINSTRLFLFFEAKVISIVNQSKQNDKQEVFAINFIANHGYDDEAIKISKSYTGKLEDISEKILKNELDMDLTRDTDYFGAATESIQQEVRVISPYTSPIETVKWLLDRATEKNGSPFFVWQSMWGKSKELKLGNFKTMVTNGIRKADEREDDFTYSHQGMSVQQEKENREVKGDTSDQQYIIKRMKTTKLEDTLRMVREGSVGSMLQSLDTFTTQKIERHFEISQVMKEFEELKVFDFIYDKDRTIIDEPIEDHDARYRNLVTSYGTYNTVNSYHDVFDQVDALNKVRSMAIKSAMYRNMIEVEFHGFEFWDKELSVGDVIKIQYFASTTDDLDAEQLSLQRSGYYLIHDLRHTFQLGRHDVICSLCKLRHLDDKPFFKGHIGQYT